MSATVVHHPAIKSGAIARVGAIDWQKITADLDEQGWAAFPKLLTLEECQGIAGLYSGGGRFRSKVVTARHGFGKGEYQYFAYPLPDLVEGLRTALYPPLASIGNRWNEAMGIGVRFPDNYVAFLGRCHAAGQTRPTPLLLQYGPGDYNCLHQDLYGEHVFPLQVAALLSEPGGGFRRRRVRADRAASAYAIAAIRGSVATWRCRDLRGESEAGAWLSRLLPHSFAPRGKQDSQGAPPHRRDHLP